MIITVEGPIRCEENLIGMSDVQIRPVMNLEGVSILLTGCLRCSSALGRRMCSKMCVGDGDLLCCIKRGPIIWTFFPWWILNVKVVSQCCLKSR